MYLSISNKYRQASQRLDRCRIDILGAAANLSKQPEILSAVADAVLAAGLAATTVALVAPIPSGTLLVAGGALSVAGAGFELFATRSYSSKRVGESTGDLTSSVSP